MRKGARPVVSVVAISFILILSMSVVSAGFFSDFWDFITGKATNGEPLEEAGTCEADTNGDVIQDDCDPGYAPKVEPGFEYEYECSCVVYQCDSGACCDIETNSFISSGTICPGTSSNETTEYQCSSLSSLGASIQKRTVTKGQLCTGSSSSCPSTSTTISVTGWTNDLTCPSTQYCKAAPVTKGYGCFIPTCGLRGVEPGEQCDNGESNGIVPTVGYGETKTYCTNECTTASVTGPKCGDGLINGNEQCDGTNLSVSSCSVYNSTYESGTLSCKSDCTFNTNNCLEPAPVTCGNGDIDVGEQCDGTALAGKACQSLEYASGVNYTGGTLSCKSNCQGYNTTQCDVPQIEKYSIERISYSKIFEEDSDMTFSCIFNIRDFSGALVSNSSKVISNTCIVASVEDDFSVCSKVSDSFDSASKEYRRTFKCDVGGVGQNKEIKCAVNTNVCVAGNSPTSDPGLINVTAEVAEFDFSFRTRTSNTVTASSGEIRRFTFDGVTEHTLEITFISSTSVTFIVRSHETEVTLREGESEQVDVDDDEKDDLEITLSDIDDGEVTLDIEYIAENEEVGVCEDENFRYCGSNNRGTQSCVDGFWSVCNYNTAGSSSQTASSSSLQNLGPGSSESEIKSTGTIWLIVIIVLIIGIIVVTVIVMKKKISKVGQSHHRQKHPGPPRHQGPSHPRGPPRHPRAPPGPPPGFPGGGVPPGQPGYRR
jgi:hypothetical protein